MSDYLPIILLLLAGAVLLYWVDDGRIRVGVFAAVIAWFTWRNRQGILDSSTPPKPTSLDPIIPDTTKVEADAQATNIRIDAISHDRPDDPDVRAALDLIDAANSKRRDRNAD